MNGGYQILDLKGTNFTDGTPATVKGAYATIANSQNKATLIENYSIGGVSQFAGFASMEVSGTNYTCTVGTRTFVITSTDSVTISLPTAPAQQATK